MRPLAGIPEERGRVLAGMLAREAHRRWLESQVLGILEGAFVELTHDVLAAAPSSRDRARLAALWRQVGTRLSRAYGEVADRTVTHGAAYAEVEFEAARAELALQIADSGRALADVSAAALLDNTVQAIAAFPIEGLPLGDWWRAQAANMSVATRRTLQIGMVKGESGAELVARIIPPRDSKNPAVFRQARAQATTLVRTATLAIHNDAAMRGYVSAGADVTAWYELITARDNRVSQICAALDGKRYSYDDPARKVPPFHMQCLPGDSLITAAPGIAAVCKRWYDGELVTVVTADGRKLRCTPNHPVLTPGGWCAAGALDVGGEVIGHRWREGEAWRRDHDGEQAVATIQEVAESWRARVGVRAVEVPVASPDFHGDGIAKQVAVVWTDSSLLDGLEPASAEQTGELAFRGAGVRPPSLASAGDRFQMRHWLSLTAARIVRGTRDLLALDSRQAAESRGVALGTRAAWDAEVAQRTIHGSFRDAEAFGNGGGTESLEIPAHDTLRIARVERDQSWHGYVYNLETETGWYGAEGIITHNCRTTTLPVLNYAGLGMKEPGKRSALSFQSFDAWLTQQPNTTQAQILGVTRAAWYRRGRMGLEELVNRDTRVLTLDELRTTIAPENVSVARRRGRS